MSGYSGEERRRGPMDIIQRDRLLTEVASDIRWIKDEMIKHFEDDKNEFALINRKVDKQGWYLAIGLGIVSAVEFFKDKIFK